MKLSYSMLFILLIANLSFFNEIECIRNGDVVKSEDLNKLKYLVGILAHARGSSLSEVCGGAILSKSYILTAAHCFVPKGATSIPDHDTITVIAHTRSNRMKGPENSIVRGVSKIFVPNSYFTARGADDIAVIKLNKELYFLVDFSKIQSVKLPPAGFNTAGIVGAVVAGYGANDIVNGKPTSDGKLRSMEVYVVPDPALDTDFVSARTTPDKDGKPRGFCAGDSGSPLVIEEKSYLGSNYIVIGTVKGNKKDCDDTLKPGVYTRVSHYLDFINAAQLDPSVSNNVVAVKVVTEANSCPAK